MKSKENLVDRARDWRRREWKTFGKTTPIEVYVHILRHIQSRNFNRVPRALKRP